MLTALGYRDAVAVWKTQDIIAGHVDFDMARNGFVGRADDSERRAETVGWLEAAGYRVLRFDAANWNGTREMLREIGQALTFPDSFGMNLDALDDCLGDVAEGEYGWTGGETGIVLLFTSFSDFRSVDDTAATALMDIVSSRSRYAALFGNRILTVVS